jgi:hypothetical protein
MPAHIASLKSSRAKREPADDVKGRQIKSLAGESDPPTSRWTVDTLASADQCRIQGNLSLVEFRTELTNRIRALPDLANSGFAA